MKIESRTITVSIDFDEWIKVYKEFKSLRYADKPKKYDYKDFPNMDDLLESINCVAQNPAHKIERKINTF